MMIMSYDELKYADAVGFAPLFS